MFLKDWRSVVTDIQIISGVVVATQHHFLVGLLMPLSKNSLKLIVHGGSSNLSQKYLGTPEYKCIR